ADGRAIEPLRLRVRAALAELSSSRPALRARATADAGRSLDPLTRRRETTPNGWGHREWSAATDGSGAALVEDLPLATPLSIDVIRGSEVFTDAARAEIDPTSRACSVEIVVPELASLGGVVTQRGGAPIASVEMWLCAADDHIQRRYLSLLV